jgi:hypothetical protein
MLIAVAVVWSSAPRTRHAQLGGAPGKKLSGVGEGFPVSHHTLSRLALN